MDIQLKIHYGGREVKKNQKTYYHGWSQAINMVYMKDLYLHGLLRDFKIEEKINPGCNTKEYIEI